MKPRRCSLLWTMGTFLCAASMWVGWRSSTLVRTGTYEETASWGTTAGCSSHHEGACADSPSPPSRLSSAPTSQRSSEQNWCFIGASLKSQNSSEQPLIETVQAFQSPSGARLAMEAAITQDCSVRSSFRHLSFTNYLGASALSRRSVPCACLISTITRAVFYSGFEKT